MNMESKPSARRFSPSKTGHATPLGHLERAVMSVVWANPDPTTVGEVHAALPTEPKVAYTTVKTTLERLASKGILIQEKSGKAYLYRAALNEEELERRIVTETLDKLVQQFPAAVASFFVQPSPDITQEKLDLLRDAIVRKRGEDGDG
jgi:predicted transcriptional regulator